MIAMFVTNAGSFSEITKRVLFILMVTELTTNIMTNCSAMVHWSYKVSTKKERESTIVKSPFGQEMHRYM